MEMFSSICSCGCGSKSHTRKQEYADFEGREAELAALIAAAIAATSEEFVAKLEKELDNFSSSERFLDVMDAAAIPLRNVANDDTKLAEKIDLSIFDTVAIGAATVGVLVLFSELERQAIQSGVSKSVKFFTNNFFDRITSPTLKKAVEAAGGDVTILRTQIKEIVEKSLLKPSPYWNVVANQNISRSFHYGVLKAGEQSRFTGYRLVAVIDNRTTPICQELDGTEYFIADGIAKMDQIAQADENSIKEVAPWVKSVDDIKDLSSSDLASMGVLVPPFHGNCRTSMELI